MDRGSIFQRVKMDWGSIFNGEKWRGGVHFTRGGGGGGGGGEGGRGGGPFSTAKSGPGDPFSTGSIFNLTPAKLPMSSLAENHVPTTDSIAWSSAASLNTIPAICVLEYAWRHQRIIGHFQRPTNDR